MEKGESASGVNGNVGVVACTIVEGKGGVEYVRTHAKIVATTVRVRVVVPGEIVEREGKPVPRCQHNDIY
jgi:hypothetical protein